MAAKLSFLSNGLLFPNCLGPASAPPTNNAHNICRAFAAGYGFAVTKTITSGEVINPSKRVKDLIIGGRKAGKINIELISTMTRAEWLDDIRRIKDAYPDRILIASIMEASEALWAETTGLVIEAGADGIEVNGSCGHGMSERGMGTAIGEHDDLVGLISSWVVRAAGTVPVWFKLTPNTPSAVGAARAAFVARCKAVTAVNTARCLPDADPETGLPILEIDGYTTTGGLSGEAMGWLANARIADCAHLIRDEFSGQDLAVSGSGGVSTFGQLYSRLAYGATTVQICTAIMNEGFEPVFDRLSTALLAWMERKGHETMADFVGCLVPNVIGHGAIVAVSQEQAIKRNVRVRTDADATGDIVDQSNALAGH